MADNIHGEEASTLSFSAVCMPHAPTRRGGGHCQPSVGQFLLLEAGARIWQMVMQMELLNQGTNCKAFVLSGEL